MEITEMFLFKGAKNESVKLALMKSTRVSYRIGEEIKEKKALGFMEKGRAKVEKVSEKKAVPLKMIEEGEVFGAASLFGYDEEYVTSITALTDCRAVFMSQELVETIIKIDSKASLNYIYFLSDRVRFLNKKIDSFTSGSVEKRLARYLAEASYNSLSGITYKQLASALDIGRASLYRVIESFVEKGYIEKSGREINILKLSDLKNLI